MPTESELRASARALDALEAAIPGLELSTDRTALARTIERGHFRPDEEDALFAWFARYLSVREELWSVIADVSEDGQLVPSERTDESSLRHFVLGYAAACLIVRLSRYLVEDLATHTFVQRKLNEGASERRIPRKQFTAVFESLTRPRYALLILKGMNHRDRHRDRIDELGGDPVVGTLVTRLPEIEKALDPSKRRYLKLLHAYGDHALRRRGASTKQKVAFTALETGGRLVSELRDHWRPKRVDERCRAELARLLRPGDVLVTRHEHAVTNLFLPGFWPHSALYVGTEVDRERLRVEIDAERLTRWRGDCCVLEALKDGVRFRPLDETLAVDAVAVVRPRLDERAISMAIARAARHEGKPYNFDFDFFRSDRLVCTEVVFRAFDGIGSLQFDLRERSGRPTLSAEDLLDLALAGVHFEPLAVFGVGGSHGRLVVGPDAARVIAESYR